MSLTPRQLEIAALIAQALPNRDIAERLQLSEQTVKNHLVAIYQRLKVASRGQLILLMLQGGKVS